MDRLITSKPSLNETAYAELGPLYMSTQLRWGMFFDFASYASAMVWMVIFGYPAIKGAWLKFKERRTSSGSKKSISEQCKFYRTIVSLPSLNVNFPESNLRPTDPIPRLFPVGNR